MFIDTSTLILLRGDAKAGRAAFDDVIHRLQQEKLPFFDPYMGQLRRYYSFLNSRNNRWENIHIKPTGSALMCSKLSASNHLFNAIPIINFIVLWYTFTEGLVTFGIQKMTITLSRQLFQTRHQKGREQTKKEKNRRGKRCES